MKVLMINSVCGTGSTGRICTDIANILIGSGNECKIVYGRGNAPQNFLHATKIASKTSVKKNVLISRFFDNEGFNAKKSTKKLVRLIKDYNPDLIHLHNLHGYYLNIPILFDYLKNEFQGQVVWSLYDCWPFTGHCAHFDFVGCKKWEKCCHNCSSKKKYPKSILFSGAKRNYLRKKKALADVKGLNIIVPSKWLNDMVSKSFLSEYPRSILPNGIDLTKFYQVSSASKTKLQIDEDKFVVLGVSGFWTETKGVEFFIKLSKELPSDKYQVVLVGNLHETKLPENILHIPATNNIEELCEIYSIADVFVNPTLQETQGLTTVEALACGTPVIVFNSGGAPECVDDSCGIVVDKGDYQALKEAVISIADGKVDFDKGNCRRRAEEYDSIKRNNAIISLYKDIVSGKYMSGKKKYCFVSNYLTPHQLPFCLAMVKKPDVQFIFIETEKLPEERIKLGYPVLGEKYDFVLNAKNSDEAYASALDIVNESDVVIIGSAPDKFISKRLRSNKLTFRFSERIFKKRYHDPLRWIKYTLKNYKYRNKNLYYLLSSAYAAHDYKRCGAKTDKMFKWGYFPKTHKERVCIERCKNSCLWIGRFLDLKHADDAIDAIIRLNREGYNVKLDLIGTGEREESLKQLVIINNAERYVNFLGSKPNEEVFEHMCRSEIFLFTSDYNEGWGAVLNEAMDSGLVVVASHAAGSVPFMVKHGENGLIYEYGKENALYEKLKLLLDDNNKVKDFSEHAVQTMLKEWNAENASNKLLNFCQAFFDGEIEKGICQSGVLSRAQAIPQKKMYKKITKGN